MSLQKAIVPALLLAPLTAPAAEIPFGPRQPIASTTSFLATFVAAADVDGDRDADLVWAGWKESVPGGEILWLENVDGRGAFGPAQTIASSTGGTTLKTGFGVADLDGDGDLDVLDRDFWHENAAGDGSSWVAHAMPSGIPPTLTPVDLDQDGDVDVLVRIGNLAWLENDGASPPGWTVRPIGDPGNASSHVAAAADDLDGDGDLDVASFDPPTLCGSGCVVPGSVKWFENDGASPPGWTEHVMPEPTLLCQVARIVRLHLEDFDSDGDLDVVAACWQPSSWYGDTAWYENDGAPNPSFTEHALAMGPALPFDLDRDDDTDLLGPGNDFIFYLDMVAWHENDGGMPLSLTVHAIEGPQQYPTDYAPFDVDLDGDIDLVLCDQDELVWYENATEPIPALPGPRWQALAALLLAAVGAWLARTGPAAPPIGLRGPTGRSS